MSHKRSRAITLLLVVLFILTQSGTQAQTLYRVTIQQGVRVKMRDGVTLAADVYRPVSDEKFPVILQRTPYNRAGGAPMANELASHGYVVVMQDTHLLAKRLRAFVKALVDLFDLLLLCVCQVQSRQWPELTWATRPAGSTMPESAARWSWRSVRSRRWVLW
jgi:hypothetical protein